MVEHSYNPSTGEAEAGRLQVRRQPELQSETWSQKKKKKDLSYSNDHRNVVATVNCEITFT
jgi:hypothetical protein